MEWTEEESPGVLQNLLEDRWSPGETLPPERRLAEELWVSRRRASSVALYVLG